MRPAFALMVLTVAGCTRDVGSMTLLLLKSPRAADPNENPLPDNQELTVGLRIEAPDFDVRKDSAAYVPGETTLEIPEVPVGRDRVFTITVTNPSGAEISRARSLPVTIESRDQSIALFLSRVGRPSEANRQLTVERFRHSATVLPDGRVLLAAGATSVVPGTLVEATDGVPDAEIFDPTTARTVTRKPDCSAGGALCLFCPRAGHAAALEPSGETLLAGGDLGCGSVERFADDRFELGAPLDPSPVEPAALSVADGVVVAGGLIGGEPSAEAHLFAGDESRVIKGGLSEARYGAATVSLPDGSGLVIGGITSAPPPCDPEADDGPVCRARGTVTGVVDRYDPATGRFERLEAALELPRAFATATLLTDGRVAIVGGLGATTDQEGQNLPIEEGSIEILDPAEGSTRAVGRLLVRRWFHATVLVGEDVLYVFGGYEQRTTIGDHVEQIDLRGVRRPQPIQLPVLHVPRAGHTATLMGNGAILIAGGVTNDGASPEHATRVAEIFWPPP